jgi:hypothetical protein
LADDKTKGLRQAILTNITTPETLGQENFEKGLYRGLLSLDACIEEVRQIIQQKDKS